MRGWQREDIQSMVPLNRERHHRHSLRLKGYDYSQVGAYFITICVRNRECLFGEIVNGKMFLNNAGHMVEKWYFELPKKYSDIQCLEYIVMPNHFHCIIQNVGADLHVCPYPNKGEHAGSPLRNIVQWFKTMTTNDYIRNAKQNGWEPFEGKLWQRNYYEHIIRNETELNALREYIVNNPLKWDEDEENPNKFK